MLFGALTHLFTWPQAHLEQAKSEQQAIDARRHSQELMRQAKVARAKADAQRAVASEEKRKAAEQAQALESKDKLNRMMSQWKSDANVAKAVELGDTSLIKKKKVCGVP